MRIRIRQLGYIMSEVVKETVWMIQFKCKTARARKRIKRYTKDLDRLDHPEKYHKQDRLQYESMKFRDVLRAIVIKSEKYKDGVYGDKFVRPGVNVMFEHEFNSRYDKVNKDISDTVKKVCVIDACTPNTSVKDENGINISKPLVVPDEPITFKVK